MARTITLTEARETVLTLHGAERFAPAWIVSGSRESISGFNGAYQFLAKRFIGYLENKFGKKNIDKDAFSHLFIRFLSPFCAPEFLRANEKTQHKAWKAIEGMLNLTIEGQSYAIGNGEFIAA
jgi:hypothetical protein